MNNINPIIIWNPINIINSIIFILFLILLYFLWKFKPPLTPPSQGGGLKKTPLLTKEGLGVVLSNFEKKYFSSKKDIFYRELAKILKEILEYKWYKNISKMTFEEIDNLLGYSQKNSKDTPCGYPGDLLKDLIKNIYFKEYAKEIEDSEEIRKKLILEVKKLI